MIKKLRAALVAIALSLGIGVAALGGALPAQAFTSNGCPDGGHVCFYNYESFNVAGGIYVLDDIPGCYVMPVSGVSGWTNGKVYNATTSILLNWTGSNTIQRTITYYDSNACSPSDYKFVSIVYPGQLQTQLSRLADIGWNDRIGSVKIQ